MYILREIPHNKGYAKIVAKRPLEHLLQITSKKKRPDTITLRYGQPNDDQDGANVMISDQLIVPKQSEAIEMIKLQIHNSFDPDN